MFATQRQTPGFRERTNGKRSSERAFPPTTPTTIAQRASCACGGACPRCRDKHSRQEKFNVSQPGDALEQEADRVAEQQVLRIRQPAPPDNPEAQEGSALRLSRYAPAWAPGSPEAPPIVHEVLRMSGAALPVAARGEMQARFGQDMGAVRVHTDAQAARSADAVGARAYTVGSHIVFNAGQYAPATVDGRRTLVHELVHVAQQRGAAPAPSLAIGSPGDATECEADGVAANIAHGSYGPPVRIHARSSVQTLRRQSRGVDEAIAGGTLAPVPGVHGNTFYAENCFGIAGCEVGFRFSRAYIGTYVPGRGENPRRGAHVLIAANHEPECGNCASLEIIQVMRDVRKSTRSEMEAFAPPTLHEMHRRRSGWGGVGAASRGWRVDAAPDRAAPGYDPTDPFYTHTPVGRTGIGGDNAVIVDSPWNFDHQRNVGKQFQACLICIDGSRRTALGCTTWGYYIDASQTIHFFPPAVTCGETRQLRDAVQRWEGIEEGNQPVDLDVRGR